MASTVNIRTYRPQQLSVRESQRAVPHLRIALGREQRRVLTVAAGIALQLRRYLTPEQDGREGVPPQRPLPQVAGCAHAAPQRDHART